MKKVYLKKKSEFLLYQILLKVHSYKQKNQTESISNATSMTKLIY